ncbi:bifunctional ADP-dependent NAD(P)H-hydrate dehydratase/NAD(P)H-hydrate epimerase [Halolamina sediminis]|uniref:bifunctional ADP-dependent NAD(P)H-hydrate dehydratase/NAD(P)H-hydrate epimerase n=1 Tax=Halolamina sediminis TaxID=1480675 RepID=UPI0006B62248|nr:bifunctional ADP-dependent NAD(P)H-hydrate dehydratase/NAD(P)H-hydrate epimerase [Halolamina sediminis]
MITSRRMAAVDRNAAALGVPLRALMESSGNAVARRVRELTARGDSVTLVCGRGNNGGDALVAARFLDDRDVEVKLLGRPESITTEIARANWEALEAAEIDAEIVTDSHAFDLDDPDLLVDAMLGTGITGELREPEASAAHAINDSAAPVLAVDVPSGVDADTAATPVGVVEAEHVVTFHDLKPGLAEHADVTVADIGIPAAAEEVVGPGDVAVLGAGGSRKGDSGQTFVIGGGPYTGAPALAAGASLSAGADLAFVACPESVFAPIAGYSEDLIVQPYGDDGENSTTDHLAPEHVPELVDTAERHDDTVILGPGLGRHPETEDAARQFLAEFSGTAVVDADALPLVPEVDTDAALVLTPNRSELAELDGPEADDLVAHADEIRELAADLGHTILAKGVVDVITDGETVRRCRAGTPGMTVGGTGDTLAGIVAALLSRAAPFEAACVGSYVNGRAAELLDRGDGLRATELQETIPAALEGGDDD